MLGPLTERIRSVYGDEAIPIGRWGLEHKLLRDTPSCLPPSAYAPNPAPPARYVQFLSMTTHPKLGFVYASATDNDDDHNISSQQKNKETTQSGMIMATLPIASSAEIFRHFVRNCEPIWCHRHTVTVTGTVYEVGDFRIRVGELRQTQPQARVRGTIMEIEWNGPSMIAAALSDTFLKRQQHEHDQHERPGNNHTDGLSSSSMDVDINADVDSAMDTPYIPSEEEIQLEYEQASRLIQEFWSRIQTFDETSTSTNSSTNNTTNATKQLFATTRQAILVSDVGREIKQRISQRREPGWQEREIRRQRKRREAIALDRSWNGLTEKQPQQDDEDDEVDTGVDLARQYMELFRFNR